MEARMHGHMDRQLFELTDNTTYCCAFAHKNNINHMGFQTYIWYNRQKCIIEYVIGIGKGLEIYESCTTISI